jgi:hypothetical protein
LENPKEDLIALSLKKFIQMRKSEKKNKHINVEPISIDKLNFDIFGGIL